MTEISVFDKTLRHYLDEIGSINASEKSAALGIEIDEGDFIIGLFNRKYRVTKSSVTDLQGRDVSHAIRVILCKYLLLYSGQLPNQTDWVTYKDFQDAAPFVGAFSKYTEKTLAQNFSGRLSSLENASKVLGGKPLSMDLAYDLIIVFQALPKVPVLLLFNDADDEFDAKASVLFERCAADFLDVECLAMVGWILSDALAALGGGKQSGIR
jgi:hypothetical protein